MVNINACSVWLQWKTYNRDCSVEETNCQKIVKNTKANNGEGSSSGSVAMATTSERGNITSSHAEIDVPV